jgi:hypothetical protein
MVLTAPTRVIVTTSTSSSSSSGIIVVGVAPVETCHGDNDGMEQGYLFGC